jgi:hypothetical protein
MTRKLIEVSSFINGDSRVRIDFFKDSVRIYDPDKTDPENLLGWDSMFHGIPDEYIVDEVLAESEMIEYFDEEEPAPDPDTGLEESVYKIEDSNVCSWRMLGGEVYVWHESVNMQTEPVEKVFIFNIDVSSGVLRDYKLVNEFHLMKQ